MFDVITVGETMLLVVPPNARRLRHATSLELKVGGAESNLAIALSRLGFSVSWISALGTDEPGQLVLDRIRGEGVDTSHVRRVEGHPTGLYLREDTGTQVRVYYYRENSAASTLTPGFVDSECLRETRTLHLSGVTPALSASCAAFVQWAIQSARELGVKISFDVNYRAKLWRAAEARRYLEDILDDIDLLFVSTEEAEQLWGAENEDLVEKLSGRGARDFILKRGKEGALAMVDGHVFSCPGFDIDEVDPVGAGDAFAAGYLAGEFWKLSPEERLRVANAMGAHSVMTLGDYEGLPNKDELFGFMNGQQIPGR